ncbi:MAG: transglutaminase-like domain-containing protein [Planctomycetota bacterium]|jgi:hypothetical protein
MSRTFTAAILFILLGALALPLHAEEGLVRYPVSSAELEARLGIHWYGLYMQKRKVGYVKMENLTRGEGEARVWIARYEGVMKIKAMGQKVENRFDEELVFDGSPPYALRSGTHSQSMSGSAQMIRVKRVGDGLEVSVSGGGESYTKTIPPLDFTLADEASTELWIARGPAKGDRIRHRSLDLDQLLIDEETKEAVGVAESVVEGVKTKVYEVKAESKRDGPLGVARVTSEGLLLSIVLGGILEARLEPEKLARKITYSRDLFIFGMARLDRPLGIPPAKAKILVLEVHGEGAPKIPSRVHQSLEKQGGVHRLTLGPEAGPSTKATEEEIREGLRDTPDYPIRHERIVALKDKALGSAEGEAEKVKRLIAFTETFIRDGLVPDKVSIFDIIEKRRGDCSEHAHLFTALARAAGIPTREVGGLAYMGDEIRAFGGHAWCEVVLDGKWVPVDPTWGEAVADATHIGFDDKAGTDYLSTMGRLSFRLVSVNGVKPK